MIPEFGDQFDADNLIAFRRPSADPEQNPTAAGLLLGLQLKALRSGRTLKKVVEGIDNRLSQAKLSRLENGESPPKPDDIRALLRFYKAEPQIAEVVEELARHAAQPNWLHSYRDVLSSWVERLMALESAAIKLITYEAKIVPGLIQTQDYSRAIFRLELPSGQAHRLDRYLSLRGERQERFLVSPPRSVFLLEHSTLYRKVGSPRVMVDQLQRLIDLTSTRGFGVRIITLDHFLASSVSSLTHLDFGRSGLPELIYNERLRGADYCTPTADERPGPDEDHKVSEMEEYKQLLWQLVAVGTERQESRELLLEAKEHFEAQL
ncbi:helix-turn-helix domain-containing protein [Kitasatospora sp. NPDC058170]|uniref:helix-turn-helix domain-containing protein n=1 Tax=Kitasatospora sp. NPDC058170 TaxID=3346364 RepID=UPI0036DE6B1B